MVKILILPGVQECSPCSNTPESSPNCVFQQSVLTGSAKKNIWIIWIDSKLLPILSSIAVTTGFELRSYIYGIRDNLEKQILFEKRLYYIVQLVHTKDLRFKPLNLNIKKCSNGYSSCKKNKI